MIAIRSKSLDDILHRSTTSAYVAVCWLALTTFVLSASNAWGEVTLVEAGPNSSWKFVDNGAEPAVEWRLPGFDDSRWKTGQAPLGYGEQNVSTQLSFGENAAAKPITTYFRKQFEVANNSDLRELLLLLRVDDGAVVYLNGREIARENLPASPTNGNTTALRRIGNSQEGTYHRHLISAEVLVPGRNEICVEVHQFDAMSSDLYFDLLLKGYGTGDKPSRAKLIPAARDVALAFRENHYVAGKVAIPDGFVDGGRRMHVDDAGIVRTDREVIVVDRARDAELRRHLAYAKSEFIASQPTLAKARFLALYVDAQLSPPAGRQSSLTAVELIESEFLDREMPLGKSAGCGVCRHRALLFKLLADEAGLDVALVRGNLSGAGAHTWNELRLNDENRRIVDCMNPSGGFEFPDCTDPAAQQYLSVRNQPYYPTTKPSE